MHIAINAWFWNQPHTGSGQYTRQLVYYLNRLVSDLEVTLIYPQKAGEQPLQAVPPSVKQHGVPTRPGNIGKLLFEQMGFAQACGKVGATVAHVPYWGAPLRCPVPLVVTIHDLTTELIRDYRRGAMTRLYNALVSASAKSADHIITDSFSSKLDVVEHLHIPEPRVTAIYLGIDHALYTPEANLILDMAIKKQYDLPDEYVLYLGGYVLHKNVTTLLLAYSYVAQALGTDYPLLLAGKRPDKISPLFPDYNSYIEKLGLTDHVRWLGFVEEDHKPVLYRTAKTFVFPSRAEGFGLPPLEAMACGTPVVTTDSTSLPEIVGSAAFTVKPDSAREMAGAIIATLVQENLARQLREAGLQQVQEFRWEKTAHETLWVYDDVAK